MLVFLFEVNIISFLSLLNSLRTLHFWGCPCFIGLLYILGCLSFSSCLNSLCRLLSCLLFLPVMMSKISEMPEPLLDATALTNQIARKIRSDIGTPGFWYKIDPKNFLKTPSGQCLVSFLFKVFFKTTQWLLSKYLKTTATVPQDLFKIPSEQPTQTKNSILTNFPKPHWPETYKSSSRLTK